MKRCLSFLKPVDGVCQHTQMPCTDIQHDCLNWREFEYYDPEKTYPPGTQRLGDEMKVMTNKGWRLLEECKPRFSDWGFTWPPVETVYVKGEEFGCMEYFDRKANNIKRIARNLEVASLEKQWN